MDEDIISNDLAALDDIGSILEQKGQDFTAREYDSIQSKIYALLKKITSLDSKYR